MIFGDGGDDLLNGRDGDDTLYGGAGEDILYGSAGEDALYGGASHDRLYGGAGEDHLYGGVGEDHLYGDASHDRLYGDAGRDHLTGGDGDDTLHGNISGWLPDILYGGAGADIFVKTPEGRADIRDFEDGTDSIQLEGGLSFADLTIYIYGFTDTLIEVTASGEELAFLVGFVLRLLMLLILLPSQ